MKKLLAVLLLAGCSSSSGSSAMVSYYKDVKPLVETKCTMCHQPGAIAPFPLQSYDDLNSHKAQIRAAVATRLMPPWLAGKNCNSYKFDRSLSDDQIKTITDWVDQGAMPGSEKDYVAPQAVTAYGLSRVDRTLMMPGAYVPQISPDDYRCFLIDWPDAQTQFISGFRAVPGTPSIVHHTIAFIVPPAQVSSYQALDGQDGKPGWTCFGGPGGGSANSRNAQWIGGWAPGALGGDYVPDTGIQIDPGSKVVLQVHYNTSTAAPAPDMTSVQLKIDSTVKKQAYVLPWTNYQWILNKTMDIPAGASDAEHDFSYDITQVMSIASNGVFQDNLPFDFYSVSMHMHTRGTHARVNVERADGSTECMLDVPRWDFHWQGAYSLADKVTFNPGDKMYLECHWDNSAGTSDVNWGEGTGDEMCLTGFYVTQ